MTIWKQWIQRSVLTGLVLGGLIGCSMIGHPPAGQIAPDDHAALAAWYDKEAAQLRENAKGEMAMAETYRKNPSYAHSAMGGSHKMSIEQHCDALAAMYTKGAEEAEQLAQEHRDLLKK
jgi:hypothetical protein